MSRRYWLVGIIIIGLVAVGILEIGLAKFNQKKEMMARSAITPPVAEEIVNKPIEEEKAFIPEEIVCPAQLPDLEKFYKDTPRIKERWDANAIGIVKGYKYFFDKGELKPKSFKPMRGNTPINADRSVLYMGFNFPSLRGEEDESFLDDRSEFVRKHNVDKNIMLHFPEKRIPVSIDRVPDWKSLPMTDEIKFWKLGYRQRLTAQQIAAQERDNERYLELLKKNNYRGHLPRFENSERYGLHENMGYSRTLLFYYEPIDNPNPSPYGLPRFSCDGAGHLGVGGCVGHIKMDDQYLITYDIPYELMPCWQEVEEGAKRVLRLNTQVAK